MTNLPHPFRKKWGQNFLRDPNTVSKIIDCLNPDKEDTILEIGPGDGWYAAANVLHGGEIIGDEAAVFVDIYSPATRWILDVLATGRKLPPRITRE